MLLLCNAQSPFSSCGAFVQGYFPGEKWNSFSVAGNDTPASSGGRGTKPKGTRHRECEWLVLLVVSEGRFSIAGGNSDLWKPKLSLPSIRLSHMRLYPGAAEDLAVLSGWLRFISALCFYYTTFSCVNTPSCLWSVNLLGHSVRWEGRNSKAHFTHRETEAWRHEATTHTQPTTIPYGIKSKSNTSLWV